MLGLVPNDMWREIFTHLDGESLFALSHTCQSLRGLICERATTVNENNFLALCSRGDLVSLIHYPCTLEEAIKGLCVSSRRGHYKLTIFFLNHGAKDLDKAFLDVCELGYINIVKLLVRQGVINCKKGFDKACKGGHLDIAMFMVDLGCNDHRGGFNNACRHGHTEVAIYCLYPERYTPQLVQDWRNGWPIPISPRLRPDHDSWTAFAGACKCEHTEIIDLFRSLFKQLGERLFNWHFSTVNCSIVWCCRNYSLRAS